MNELNKDASYGEIIDAINEIVNWINSHNDYEIQYLVAENKHIETQAKVNESIIKCFGGNNVIQ